MAMARVSADARKSCHPEPTQDEARSRHRHRSAEAGSGLFTQLL